MAREKIHRCKSCKQVFDSLMDLKEHRKTHTFEKNFDCILCNDTFNHNAGLRRHMESAHPGKRPYHCGDCSKSYMTKEQLRLHTRHHTGEKPHPCPECPKRFIRPGQLIQHRRSHLGERPYKCKLCQAEFTSTGNLKVHLKRHLGVKEFSCDVCGKQFTRRDGLQKHLSCFHGGEKPFECTICKKRYKGHLMQHFRTHLREKPHECEVCGAKFVQRSQLTVHHRIHTGEKPYPCKICGRKFAHSTALKLHIRRHTGEKPFRCPICPSNSFVQLPHLKKHMRCIHKTDKPYLCTRCGEFYQKKAELESHQETCRSDENLPPNKSSNGTQTEPSVDVDMDEINFEGEKEDDPDDPEEVGQMVIVDIPIKARPSRTSARRTKTSPRLTNVKSRNESKTSNKPPNNTATTKSKRKTKQKQIKTNITTSTSSTNTEKTKVVENKKSNRLAVAKTVSPPTKTTSPPTKPPAVSPIKLRKTRLLSVRNVQSINNPPTSPTTKTSKPKNIKVSPNSKLSELQIIKEVVKPKPTKSISEPYIPFTEPSDEVEVNESVLEEETVVETDTKVIIETSASHSVVMTADQMRVHVAELLQKISTPERLKALGFGKRVIDDVLHDSISSSGREPCDPNLPIAERLRKNVDILLEWTIPPQFMAKFRKERRTTEELLEELTS